MTDWTTIGIRFALYANLMLSFGLPFFALYALRGAERIKSAVLPLRTASTVLALVGFGLSLLSIVVMTASMTGVPIAEVDRASINAMIFDTPMGSAWQVRMGALAVLFSTVLVCGGSQRAWWLAVSTASAGIALGSLAWTGHGAAGEGTQGTVQLGADVVHLLAAGAWIGALVALAMLLVKRAGTWTDERLRLVHRVLQGFSVAGTVIVGSVMVSGLINGWTLVGPDRVLSAFGTPYGQLLCLKLVLFIAMLRLASINRYRLVPCFEAAIAAGDSAAARAHLRRSVAVETALAVVILALVAWLGTLQPPAAM